MLTDDAGHALARGTNPADRLSNGCSIVTAELDLAGCEIQLAADEHRLTRLRRRAGKLSRQPARRSNFVLIDCPPSLGVLMTNALAAADSVLVPLQCEYLALEGLAKILEMIERIKQVSGNGALVLEGIVLTMYDARTNLSQQVVNDVRDASWATRSSRRSSRAPSGWAKRRATASRSPITIRPASGAQSYRRTGAGISASATLTEFSMPVTESWNPNGCPELTSSPPFNYHGYLPEGVHDTTLDELRERFVTNPKRGACGNACRTFCEWAVSTGSFPTPISTAASSRTSLIPKTST